MTKTFRELSSIEPGNLMIVDSFNLGYRWLHSSAETFLDDYFQTVDSLKRSYKCDKVIIAADMGSSTYRKTLYPEYKANRKKKVAEQTIEEKEKFDIFFKEMQRIYSAYEEEGRYPVIRFQGVEADDIAAAITIRRSKYNIKHIQLISTDADWDLLVDEYVSRFSYVTRKDINNSNWADKYEWTRDQYISVKCLMGDSGDNVPGVPGIGPKKAQALVEQYGTCMDIIASLPINSKYKYMANLNAFGADALMLNYKLMDLVTFCEDALGEENVKKIDRILEDYFNAD